MLWDDIDAGVLGETAKTGTWYLHIKDIKDGHPKPDINALEKDLQSLFEETQPSGE